MADKVEGKRAVLPGDKLAVSEEYLPGPAVYDDSGLLRALAVGTVLRDMKKMEISVAPSASAGVIKVGDVVTGQVEVVQTSSAGLRIYYVNGRPTGKGFTGMIMLRTGRVPRGERRPGPPVKLGDIVRCRVKSTMNGIIHLSVEDDNTGVVYARCGNCGRPMLRGGNRAKCDECGNVEERKLAGDFGQTPIQP